MKILHYSLGFPPYRTGGLTKFCMDLMNQQLLEGHDVALLWPGEMKLLSYETKIKYGGYIYGIESFEIKNPLAIPYDEGIMHVESFMRDGDTVAYKTLLNEWKPDIIHIHTLMGLHKAFITAAKSCNIRLIFTAHDFFPICPKITMFRHNKVCMSINNCCECPECNMTALAMWKGWVLQHPLYRKLKESNVVKKLRKVHRDNYLGGNTSVNSETSGVPEMKSDDYKKLRAFYREILELMDCVHFNSSVTRQVYETYLGLFPSETIAITHLDINDNRRIKVFGKKLRMTYLGPQGGGKGFFCLRRHLINCGKNEMILN